MQNTYKNWKSVTDQEMLKAWAIEAALESDWHEAAQINEKIVSVSSQDVEALNRLARAQACCGQVKKALKTYKKALDIDPYNIIAIKNYEKISKLEKSDGNGNPNGKTNGNLNSDASATSNQKLSDIFLFEPGKTKIISLLNLAAPYVLASLNCADKVIFNLKKHGICIAKEDGTYLGALPDDFAHKLLSFIEGGNKYEAYVKYSTTKNLTIFIREIYRSPKFVNQPSFSTLTQSREEKNLAFA